MTALIGQSQKKLSICVILLFVIVSRISQYSGLAGQNLSFVNLYFTYFSYNYFSLALPTAYCIWISASFYTLNDDMIIVRMRSRLSVFLRQEAIIIFDAFSFTLLLNISVIPLFVNLSADNMYLILSHILLQILFFIICSLIYFLFGLLTKINCLGYIAVIMYGLWDYLYSYGRIVRSFQISTGRLASPSYSEIAAGIGLFTAFTLVLSVIILMIFEKIDFIKKVRTN